VAAGFLLFAQVLELLVGSNINKEQLSHIADRTMHECDSDNDRLITFEEFKRVSSVVGLRLEGGEARLKWGSL